MKPRSPITTIVLGLFMALAAGGVNLWLGVRSGQPGLWGLGLALWVGALPTASLLKRQLEGMDNRGLERERVTLRVAAWGLRVLAAGMALVLWLDPPLPADVGAWILLGGTLFVAIGTWGQKWVLREDHPSFAADALRSRLLVEGAVLLLAGFALGERLPAWGGRLGGLLMALRFFWAGQQWGKASTVAAAACGGCGGGCGC